MSTATKPITFKSFQELAEHDLSEHVMVRTLDLRIGDKHFPEGTVTIDLPWDDNSWHEAEVAIGNCDSHCYGWLVEVVERSPDEKWESFYNRAMERAEKLEMKWALF